MTFREIELVLFTADLAGFARATAQLRAAEVAGFLAGWYRAIDLAISKHGGGLVKYMGDSCLATFPPEACTAAVQAAMQLLAQPLAGFEVQVGVKIHLGTVAEGEVGGDRRYDIFGSAVNQLFRMGSAGSVLISEPIYQRLPADQRAVWQRHQAAAIYSLVR
jgi:adenylate cyclase